jgi:rod shape-determining protein MreC
LLIVLCLAGFLLGRVQQNARDAGRVDPVTAIVERFVRPPASVLSGVGQSTANFITGVAHAEQLTLENQALRAQLIQYKHYQDTVELLTQDNIQLKKLNGLTDLGNRKPVPARIIKTFHEEQRVSIDIGTADGVAKGQPVVAAGGMFGEVSAVMPHEAEVTLITSPDLKIGAMVHRPPPNDPYSGVLRGDSTNLVLEFDDPKAEAATDEWVFTSGYSDKIPRGLPIGQVFRFDVDIQLGYRRAFVLPAIKFGDIPEVKVLE